jgi:Spy/CpxP family protein refolding chaperone
VIQNRGLIRYAAITFAAAGLLLAQGTGTPPGTGRGAGLANRLDRIATQLSLTPDQKTQVSSIAQNAFSQAQPLVRQMRQNHQAIEQLVKGGTTANFDQQLQTLANSQGSLTAQLSVIRAKALAQAWALLTPDQQQKAGQLHDLFGMEPGMGGGMGPRMQGMRHSPTAAQQQ